jgi:hypothetical protein
MTCRTPTIRGCWIAVTGLDGSGKTTLVHALSTLHGIKAFRLPYHEFVYPCLALSGEGLPMGDALTDRA